jgi:hypothetical protein
MMNYTQVFPDIEPIPQNDGPHPVCAIDYPKKFVEAMNYLRAIMNIGEHSGACLCRVQIDCSSCYLLLSFYLVSLFDDAPNERLEISNRTCIGTYCIVSTL